MTSSWGNGLVPSGNTTTIADNDLGWGLLSQFSLFCYFPIFFRMNQNTGYMYAITFIFYRCHRSWAAGTPDKYEHDWKYPTHTPAQSKFPVTEKLTNGALAFSIPQPWLLSLGVEPSARLRSKSWGGLFRKTIMYTSVFKGQSAQATCVRPRPVDWFEVHRS